MPHEKKKASIVFAIYPNANGFGFVYMENALKLIDYGAVRISPISNKKVMERIKRSFDYLRPSIVIVQEPESKSARTGRRVKQLIKSIITYTAQENLNVVQYSRDQIKDVFEQFGAVTKYEISQVIIKAFKELEIREPKERMVWKSEDRNMAIFDALSLALTWFYLND